MVVPVDEVAAEAWSSESLVQTLAAEGINFSRSVVQCGIGSFVLHMDVGSVIIDGLVDEQRIAAVKLEHTKTVRDLTGHGGCCRPPGMARRPHAHRVMQLRRPRRQ
jgi:hypothetical protein